MSQFRKPIHVACSPLTNTIFAGTLLKDGATWGAGKQDVTIEALFSVAQHALTHKERSGSPVVLSVDSRPRYRITVEDLSAQPSVPTPEPDNHLKHQRVMAGCTQSGEQTDGDAAQLERLP